MYRLLKFFLLLIIMVAFASSIAQNNVIDPLIKVKSRGDKNVSLVWRGFTGDVSQYILERSIDARKFQEVAVFVVMFGDDEPFYEFTDRFKTSYGGPLYYRLRVEGLDGSVIYTPVTVLKAVQNKYTE